MPVRVATRNYYTDVLCHEFSPSVTSTTDRSIAVGTNFGDVYMLRCDDCVSNFEPPYGNTESDDQFTPVYLWRTCLPGIENEEEPVVSLSWDTDTRLFLLSNRHLYLITEKELKEDGTPQIIYGGGLPNTNDFMHFAFIRDSNSICIVSDDGKTRVLDVESQKVKLEFEGHTGVVQVCKATNEYVATAGLDGLVNIYEAQFRTNKKIYTIGDHRNSINNLDISRNSVWLAISGVESSEFPTLYNIRSGKEVPFTKSSTKTTETEQISALHFDPRDSLYWGGSSGSVFKSEDLLISHSELKASYGVGSVPQILSITTRNLDSGGIQMSVAGATNAVLFSGRGLYWDSMVHLQPNDDQSK